MNAIDVVYVICLVALIGATFLALVRVERGPSMLDRAVAVDVVTASLIGFTAIFSVLQERTDLMALMAALALVGFLSTTAIARFAADESDVDRHILTREELEALGEAEERLADDAAPIHDIDALEAEEKGDDGAERGGFDLVPGDPDVSVSAPDHTANARADDERERRQR